MVVGEDTERLGMVISTPVVVINYGANGYSGEKRKAPAVENQLPVSLEDLYNGVKKKMRLSRNVYDASGKMMVEEEILPIDIKPGSKKGTKLTFPKKGNEEPGIIRIQRC
ncbi:predicted protein [Arabidopsis lyrata subsp. lyrata]|uniref:Predicted protein n=1 Tax=Arabidopsis lyrata subsp. lyrata TaxID=81972 RepID=D7MVA7_ARALL|nr:predicted protein [Arabidopsis lyrata subsp. lyrata]